MNPDVFDAHDDLAHPARDYPAVRAKALKAIPGRWATPPPETVAQLPKSTKKDNPKKHCDVCGGWHGLPAVHLDYMGHADVTLALIEEDPLWTWEPVGMGPAGPLIERVADKVGPGAHLVMWAWLTVHGVRRLCVGTVDADKNEAEKELIGDMLRNGALRFGIGTRLWSKADADAAKNTPAPPDAGAAAATRPPAAHEAPAPETPPRTPAEGTVRGLLAVLDTADAKTARDRFRVKFGVGLSKLPEDRHEDALEWTADLVEVMTHADQYRADPGQVPATLSDDDILAALGPLANFMKDEPESESAGDPY